MIRTLNKHSRNRRFESHIGTYWMTAKAIATVLLRDGWDVFYPSRLTLEQIANGDQNEIEKYWAVISRLSLCVCSRTIIFLYTQR